MPDIQAAVEDLRTLIGRYLQQSELVFMKDDDGHYVLPFASIMVHVVPQAWGDDQTVVQVTAVTNENMRVTGDLCEYIAVQNAKMLFGKLCLYKDRQQVRFEHPLLGDFLNAAELVTAIKVVGTMAVKHEEHIKENWGGI